MNHGFLMGGCGLKIRVGTPTATTTWWRQMPRRRLGLYDESGQWLLLERDSL